MTPEVIGVLGIIILIVLFLLRVPVSISLILVGFFGTSIIRGIDIAFAQLGRTPFDTASSYSLSVIPLFILMGILLSYTGIGQDLFRTIDNWLGHIRGGIGIATIGTAGIFSAISGSLNATTATMTKISFPEMKKYNYHDRLSTACVAAGGTLGVLIPPSVVMILYGILTREPIGKLLIAGIIPGILQMLIFMATVYILVRRNPELAATRTEKATLSERMQSLVHIIPFLLLFLLSIGGIYLGVFTPTEAAGVGAVGAIIISLLMRRLDMKIMKKSLDETVRISVNIFLIIIGATLFGQFLTISQIPVKLATAIADIDLSPYIILTLILVILFILGLFIDGLSIIVLTLPILYPIIIQLGFNGIWFAVIMVIITNIGALTPPLGLSVYVIKGVVKEVPLSTIFRGVVPMIYAIALCILILILFPELATFLPSLM